MWANKVSYGGWYYDEVKSSMVFFHSMSLTFYNVSVFKVMYRIDWFERVLIAFCHVFMRGNL